MSINRAPKQFLNTLILANIVKSPLLRLVIWRDMMTKYINCSNLLCVGSVIRPSPGRISYTIIANSVERLLDKWFLNSQWPLRVLWKQVGVISAKCVSWLMVQEIIWADISWRRCMRLTLKSSERRKISLLCLTKKRWVDFQLKKEKLWTKP